MVQQFENSTETTAPTHPRQRASAQITEEEIEAIRATPEYKRAIERLDALAS